jgi:hypothetical protein
MKRMVLATLTGLMLVSSGVAMAADAPPAGDKEFNPDCHLDGINQALDGAAEQIKSSPAYGHAGKHYAKALKDLEAVKKQLREGCHAWNKEQKKKGGTATNASATPPSGTTAPSGTAAPAGTTAPSAPAGTTAPTSK